MTEPVSLAEAKAHLRVTDDDPYISDLSTYIMAARKHVEQLLNASIVIQTRTLELDAFPADGRISLPYGPVTGVTTIAYTDADGNAATVDSHTRSKDVVTPAYGETWPVTRDQIGAVTITYTAGMMTGSPATLPAAAITTAHKHVLGALVEPTYAGLIRPTFSVNPSVYPLISPQ